MFISKVSTGVIVLGILYSTVDCDTSTIFNILNPNRSSSSSSSKSQHQQPVKYQDGSLTNEISAHGRNSSNHFKVNRPKIPLIAARNGNGTGRQYMITGATGWGWPGSSAGNLDLYSLLGGLAFLGLLASLFIYMSNRSSTPTIVINGRRKKRGANFADDDDIMGDSFMDILNSLGVSLDNPWWNSQPEVDKRNVTPFKLI